MERLTYCNICKCLVSVAGRRTKKRRRICHPASTASILICSCGFGLPTAVAGQYSSAITEHRSFCPPLNPGQYSPEWLLSILAHFQQYPHPHIIDLGRTPDAGAQTSGGSTGYTGPIIEEVLNDTEGPSTSAASRIKGPVMKTILLSSNDVVWR